MLTTSEIAKMICDLELKIVENQTRLSVLYEFKHRSVAQDKLVSVEGHDKKCSNLNWTIDSVYTLRNNRLLAVIMDTEYIDNDELLPCIRGLSYSINSINAAGCSIFDDPKVWQNKGVIGNYIQWDYNGNSLDGNSDTDLTNRLIPRE